MRWRHDGDAQRSLQIIVVTGVEDEIAHPIVAAEGTRRDGDIAGDDRASVERIVRIACGQILRRRRNGAWESTAAHLGKIGSCQRLRQRRTFCLFGRRRRDKRNG